MWLYMYEPHVYTCGSFMYVIACALFCTIYSNNNFSSLSSAVSTVVPILI